LDVDGKRRFINEISVRLTIFCTRQSVNIICLGRTYQIEIIRPLSILAAEECGGVPDALLRVPVIGGSRNFLIVSRAIAIFSLSEADIVCRWYVLWIWDIWWEETNEIQEKNERNHRQSFLILQCEFKVFVQYIQYVRPPLYWSG